MAEVVQIDAGRRIVERFNPLTVLSDFELYQRYRFDRASIRHLSDMVAPSLPGFDCRRGQPVEAELQVCAALRYLASNSFQQVVGDTLNVSQPSVSRIVDRVLDAINERLHLFVTFPHEAADVRRAQLHFFQLANFPQVVGCVDGTLIRILRPSENEGDYVCRKRYHALNVMAVCDAAGRITNFVARWPGATHDSFVLRRSALWDGFEGGQLRGLVLGDSGYPCRPWLMTPYLAPQTAPQRAFNVAHRTTRVKIEQTFGRAKRRFSILHSEVRLTPEKVVKVVSAAFALHNYAIARGQPNFGDDDDDDDAAEPEAAHAFPASLNNGAQYSTLSTLTSPLDCSQLRFCTLFTGYSASVTFVISCFPVAFC